MSRAVAVLAALQAVALGVFVRGFLLTRVELHAVSPPEERAAAPPFDRALVLIVDALRADFAARQPYSVQGAHLEALPRTLALAQQLVREGGSRERALQQLSPCSPPRRSARTTASTAVIGLAAAPHGSHAALTARASLAALSRRARRVMLPLWPCSAQTRRRRQCSA